MPLPTRVLDIGERPLGNTVQGVRLLESKSSWGKYICLSHCWGSESFITTTHATLEKHKTNIRWNELPRTFQDAITFARELEVRYFWIDSLCIIQDDDDDWHAEAANMGNIYNHSFLTLAASCASNAKDGCFSSAEGFFSTVFTYDFPGFDRFHIRLSSRSKEYGQELPLNLRGWVLQESLLAERTITFNWDEIGWICREVSTCECANALCRYLVRDKTQKAFSHGKSEALSTHEVKELWASTVMNYCDRALTLEKDIFPAISGVVSRFQRFKKSRYLAGLWESSLVYDMIWSVDSPQVRPSKYRAPTWSWASLKMQGVEKLSYDSWPHLEGESYITVLNSWVNLAGPDPYGEITSASMTIVGLLAAARLERKEATPDTSDDDQIHLLTSSDPNIKDWPDVHFDYDMQQPGIYHVPVGSIVYCLKLGQLKFTLKADHEWSIFGLILTCVDEENAVFQRIGSMQSFYDEIDGQLDVGKSPYSLAQTSNVLEVLGSGNFNNDAECKGKEELDNGKVPGGRKRPQRKESFMEKLFVGAEQKTITII